MQFNVRYPLFALFRNHLFLCAGHADKVTKDIDAIMN